MNINVTQICKDQGYDGKITHIGFIKSRKNPKPLCGSIAGYDVADELAFSDYWEIALGNEVSWMCEMKGRWYLAILNCSNIEFEYWIMNLEIICFTVTS